MTDSLVTPERIRARARRAFEAGRARDSHNMNPGAVALDDWLAEYDRLAAERRNAARRHEVVTA